MVGPSDFGSGVTVIVKAVQLLAQNQLVVELASQPGANLTIQITGSGSPRISSVANAGSLLSGALAPGEIVAVFGSIIGPLPGVVNAPVNGQYSTLLGATQVLFNGTPGTIIFASETQVNAIVPFEVTGSNVQVQVSYQGQTSNILTIPLAASAPGLFPGATVNQNGSVNNSGNASWGLSPLRSRR